MNTSGCVHLINFSRKLTVNAVFLLVPQFLVALT